MKLSKEHAFLICARALCDQRTLTRYLTGAPMHRTNAERIERAARELGIDLPKREVASP